MTENRSSACRRPTEPTNACLARAIFSPAMEPDRSSTKARLTGGRLRAVLGSSCWWGATISARTKRLLRLVERMKRRSVRALSLSVLQGMSVLLEELSRDGDESLNALGVLASKWASD